MNPRHEVGTLMLFSMEQIWKIVISENFVYFGLGILISAFIAWYISSHFSMPRIRESKLKQLKSIKQTDFGQTREYFESGKDEIIDDPNFGKILIQPNGTFIDSKNGLMWIRAPWGMNWNGKEFVGSPIPLDWYEASLYFGKGASAGEDPTGSISAKDLMTASSLDSYQRGKTTVFFANQDDWRLPTAYELNCISFKTEKGDYAVSSREKPEELREKLFPGVKELTKNRFWSANQAHSGCSWGIDGNWPPGDIKPDLNGYVLFVRSCFS